MFETKEQPSETTTTQPTEQVDQKLLSAGYTETAIPPNSAWRWGRQITFAVDQTGIQMGAVNRMGRKARILDVRKVYFPFSLEGEDQRASFVSQTAEEYVRKFGGNRTNVSVLVSGPETAFRVFTMPPLPKSMLQSAVAFEAKKQVPFPIQDCRYDFRPVYRVGADGRSGLKIGLVAATKRILAQNLEPFSEVGIETGSVMLTHDVLGQLLQYLPDFSEERLYTLVNVQRFRTEISYFRGTNLEFYHLCSLGSSFLANRSDLTVFEYFAESLAGEIQNSLDYYTGQYGGQFTTRIYMYGDLAYTEDLIGLMKDHFGYEFRRFPVEDLSLLKQSPVLQPETLPVCLPVLASCVSSARLADLVPTELLVIKQKRQINQYGIAFLGLLSCLLFVGWLAARTQVTAAQKRVDALASEIASFKTTKLYDTYNLLKRQIAASQSYLEQTRPIPNYLSLNLKELSRLTPSSVRLVSYDMNTDNPEKNLTLNGVVHAAGIPPEVILAEYVETLSASPLFDNVTIASYAKHKAAGAFDMEFTLTMKGVS